MLKATSPEHWVRGPTLYRVVGADLVMPPPSGTIGEGDVSDHVHRSMSSMMTPNLKKFQL